MTRLESADETATVNPLQVQGSPSFRVGPRVFSDDQSLCPGRMNVFPFCSPYNWQLILTSFLETPRCPRKLYFIETNGSSRVVLKNILLPRLHLSGCCILWRPWVFPLKKIKVHLQMPFLETSTPVYVEGAILTQSPFEDSICSR